MVQIDGSQHPWLEDRRPKLTLLIAVDDATGTVGQTVFHTTEDTRGYLMLLEGLVRRRGSSSATTPPCLHCRQEVAAKGVAQWRRTGRRPYPPLREAALTKGGCYQAVLTHAGRFPSVSSAAVDASGSGYI